MNMPYNVLTTRVAQEIPSLHDQEGLEQPKGEMKVFAHKV